MPRFRAILSAFILLSALFSPAQSSNSQITGSIAYRERMALPPDAVIDIQLQDVSIADIAAQVIAEAMINAQGRQVPIPFTLSYDRSKVDPAHRYSVRATIRSGDGMLLFSTTQAYPVITHGAPSKVALVLHTVGHGPKAGVMAKRQATRPTPAETSAAAPQEAQHVEPAAPAMNTSGEAKPQPVPQSETPAEPENSTTAEQPAAPAESAAPSVNPGAPREAAPANAIEEKPTPWQPLATSDAKPSPAAPAQVEAGGVEPVQKEPESKPALAAPAEPAESADRQPVPPESKPAEAEAPLPEAPSAVAKPTPPTETAPSSAPALETTPGKAAPQPEAPLPEAPSALAKPTAPTETAPSSAPAPESTPGKAAPQPEAPLPEAPSAVTKPTPPTETAPSAAAPEATPGKAGSEPEAEGESSSRPERTSPATPLADTQWKLVELNGEQVEIEPPERPVTLAFSPEGKRIAGSAGCNTYLGRFRDDNGHLALSPGGMTLMACAEPAMSREKNFVEALRSADGYRVRPPFLFLTSKGKVVAKFKDQYTPD
jgi:uncharacterized lipoprotein YbaY/heat shock protein HslJ